MGPEWPVLVGPTAWCALQRAGAQREAPLPSGWPVHSAPWRLLVPRLLLQLPDSPLGSRPAAAPPSLAAELGA